MPAGFYQESSETYTCCGRSCGEWDIQTEHGHFTSGKLQCKNCIRCAVCGAYCGCFCLVAILILALGSLSIAKIVIGAIYIDDCSMNYLIPIWFIVSGCSGIVFSGSNRPNNDEERVVDIFGRMICSCVGILFNISWTIAGSVWIYEAWGTVRADGYVQCTDTILNNCTDGSCSDSLLKFAFAIVTIDWICVALWITMFGCTIFAQFCKKM